LHKIRRWILISLFSLIVLAAGVCGWRQFSNRARPADPAAVAHFQSAINAEPELVPQTMQGPDDGLLITGTLAGRQFYVAIPKNWNHAAILFANGYSMPGSSTAVNWQPLQPGKEGPLRAFYVRGYAVALSAYDKAGLDIDSAVRNTLRLNQFVHRLGADPVYSVGASMGGSVSLNMIQREPRPFQGALAVCGVVGDWTEEFGHLIDLRAVYSYFTENTPYALPGNADPRQDIFSPEPPRLFRFARPVWTLIQVKRLLRPVDRLFLAAAKNPVGPEATMIRNIAEAAGIHDDYVSFAFPIFTIGFGIEDMIATLGGSPYDNSNKVFHVSALSAEENAAMNRAVRRVHSDPVAVRNAARWKATGNFDTPLVTLHNAIDPLVSFSQEEILRQAVDASHNSAKLYQITAPPMIRPAATKGLSGTTHCGFTDDQVLVALHELEQRSSASAGTEKELLKRK
jgi:pimeloyl-ACP methyl ester carboxylesterase